MLIRLRRAHELVGHLLAAFVVTFVAAPCLHNFNHRADHVHAEVPDSAHAHPHPPAAPPAHRPVREPSASPTVDDATPAAQPHGRGALAHFGAVVTPTPLFIVPPPFAILITRTPPPARAERPRTPPRGRHLARGPPASIG